jgi:L-amino acid N-acyltransferase YncA
MDKSPLENKKPNQEKLEVRIEIATPKDWEAYKELWLLAITGKDAEMFGRSSSPEQIEEVKNRTEEEWQDFLSQENRFYVLLWEGSRAIGTGMAKKRDEEKDWWMGSGYVREDFRNKDIGKKIFAARLNEIRNRGGIKIRMGVKTINMASIHIADSFNFKKIEEGAGPQGFNMELEDVSNPEVIKKINDVLNAG